MNKDIFFNHYPKRKDDSHKFQNGHILIVAGSYGMAGACIFNIIGARSIGASYIEVYLPKDIYEIVAKNEISAVYHPDIYEKEDIFNNLKVKAISFGSGLSNLENCDKYLKQLLCNSNVPLCIDAHGLHILADHDDYFSLNKNMILTPHLGEFSLLTKLSVEEINKNKEEIAINYAKKHGVILVLKGPNTLVINKDGQLYINDSGNSALAKAGSGDVLTGMITGLSALYEDSYLAVKDAVWLHGHLADEGIKKYSKEIFDLRNYPILADQFFKEH